MLIPLKKASSEAWRTREKNGIFYPLCRRKVIERSVKKQRRKKNCWHFFSSLIATFATPYSITQSSRNYIYIYSYIYVFSSFPRLFYSQVINSVLNNWRGNNKTREFLFFFHRHSLVEFFFSFLFSIPLLSKSPSPLKWFFILYFYYWSPNGCHTQRGKKSLLTYYCCCSLS